MKRDLTTTEAKTLRQKALTLVYEREIHQKHSRTFGGRNKKISSDDAKNLFEAVKKDIDAIKPELIKAGYDEASINEATEKLLEPFKSE